MSFFKTGQIPIAAKVVIAALLCTGLLVVLFPAAGAGSITAGSASAGFTSADFASAGFTSAGFVSAGSTSASSPDSGSSAAVLSVPGSTSAGSPPAGEEAGIMVLVDGQQVLFPDQQPYADANQRVLVPIRFPMEAMGVEAEWLPASSQARLTKGSTSAIFTLGSRTYTVNGVAKTMDTEPIAMGNRTLFPIRFAAEAFGATVTWDGPARSVQISTGGTTPAADVPQPAIYKYPEDASHMNKSTLMKITSGMDGDGIKVKCTNNDIVNTKPRRDINNNIVGIARLDENYWSYYDVAATKYYGADGTYQLAVGTVLTFDVWIKWRDPSHVRHEALVLDEYQFVVPDHPKN